MREKIFCIGEWKVEDANPGFAGLLSCGYRYDEHGNPKRAPGEPGCGLDIPRRSRFWRRTIYIGRGNELDQMEVLCAKCKPIPRAPAQRKDGLYWVRTNWDDQWTVAQYSRKDHGWSLLGDDYTGRPDDDFKAIEDSSLLHTEALHA